MVTDGFETFEILLVLRMEESLVRYTLDGAFVVSTETTVLLKGVQRVSVDENDAR